MKWITREKVKVDRVACPCLIKKLVDKDAEFNTHWKWSIIGDRREDIVIKYEDGGALA